MIWAITVSAGTCALAGTGVATASTGHGVFGFHPTPAVKTVVVAAKDSSATTPKKKRIEIIDKVVRVKTTNAAGADFADPAADPAETSGGSLAGESASAAGIDIPDATPSTAPTTQKPTATTVDDDETDDVVATTTVTTVAKKADPATTVKAPTTTVKPGTSTTTQGPATTAKPTTAKPTTSTTRPPIPANCREPQWEHGRWKCDGQEND
jgi:hypothetical protein